MPKFFIISEEQKIGNRNGKENKGRILHGGGLVKQSALRNIVTGLRNFLSRIGGTFYLRECVHK